MKLKKYGQFIKEGNTPDFDIDNDEIEPTTYHSDNSIHDENDEELDDEEFINHEEEEYDTEEDSMDPMRYEETEDGEEEGYQYDGAKRLAELADKLGTEVVNNTVEHNGKIIHFYSETNMFHVDGQKFKTADEVIEFIGGYDSINDDDIEEIEPQQTEIVESKRHRSYRKSRIFKRSK